MHSRARLTYTQVWNWLVGRRERCDRARRRRCCRICENLYALYHALAAARETRGAIDFETIEMQIEFDAHGKIDAHRARRRATTRTS